MTAGLGLVPSAPELSEAEEEKLDRFYGYLLMSPSELNALPEDEQELYCQLSRTYHLNRIYLTRTATKQQTHHSTNH